MLMRALQIAAFSALVATGASAATVTFDNDSQCVNADLTVTAGPNAVHCVVTGGPTGSNALIKGGETSSYWVATFNSLVDFVSIDLGDNGDDADELFLVTFDSQFNATDVVMRTIGEGVAGMHTLSLAVANTAAVAFGTTGFEGNGGIYADNLTYNTQVSAVPVPAAALLLGTALLGMGAISRRKKS